MKFVNITNYKSTRGEKMGTRSLTQLAEYQPLGKMLANLSIAGLNASAKQAMEYYDTFRGEGDVDIPLLPRHLSPDIVDVQRVAAEFAKRKQLIEMKVRAAQQARIDELRAAQHSKQVDGAPPLAGAGGSAPPAGKPEQ